MALKKIWRIALIIIVVLVNIGCDQVSKNVVRNTMHTEEIIPVFSDYFILIKVENTGAFLGMGDQLNGILGIFLLQLMPLIILGTLLWYLFYNTSMGRDHLIAFSCVVGGGLANIYDRVVYGSVTDFMHIDLGLLKSGIFNAADVSITVGFIYIILSSWLQKRHVQA